MTPDTAIADLRFAAIDFESAGAARGETDVPVQIGIASWSPATGHGGQFVSFLRTSRPITWAARKVHGISPADLADAPAMVSLWPEIHSRLADAVVVAHGKGTERRFLRAFPGHPFSTWIDTLWLARAAWPELPSHSLGAVCRRFALADAVDSLVAGRRWHDALYDAAASLVLLEHIIGSFGLAGRPLAALLTPDASAWHRSRQP
jgi:DNA polymerase-3 subunit epsilon